MAHAHEVIERLQEISLDSKDAEDAARASVSSGDRRDVARCLDDLTQAKERERDLESMVAGNTAQLKNALVVRRLIDRQADVMIKGARAGHGDDTGAALAILDHAGFSSGLQAAVLAIETEEHRVVLERTAFQERTTGVSRTLLVLAGIFSIGLIGAAAWRMLTDFKIRAAAEQALSVKEEQYRQVVELAGDIICRTDDQGRFTFFNQAALSMLHFTEAEVLGRSYLKLIRQDKRRQAERFYLRQTGRKQRSTYHEFPLVDGHGGERWVGQNVQLVLESGQITGFQAIARDITDRRRTEFELKKSRSFIERIAATTPGMLYVYDLVAQQNVFSNREAVAVLGYSPERIWTNDGSTPSLFTPTIRR